MNLERLHIRKQHKGGLKSFWFKLKFLSLTEMNNLITKNINAFGSQTVNQHEMA